MVQYNKLTKTNKCIADPYINMNRRYSIMCIFFKRYLKYHTQMYDVFYLYINIKWPKFNLSEIFFPYIGMYFSKNTSKFLLKALAFIKLI